jgi:hypothetical protein
METRYCKNTFHICPTRQDSLKKYTCYRLSSSVRSIHVRTTDLDTIFVDNDTRHRTPLFEELDHLQQQAYQAHQQTHTQLLCHGRPRYHLE